jgi:hypothetical protein
MNTPDAHDTDSAGVSTRINIARAVNARLRDAGIPQREASERTGIPMTSFVRRITGKHPFDIDELAAIAGLLDVSVAALITYAEHAEAVVA